MADTGKMLRVSDDLTLPLDAITQSIALLAVRRAGKSNAAAVMAEEMYAAGLPWVAIDPKGDWWGLRSSRDGKGGGLPVPIFGGLHGDMPLIPEAGHLIADLIVDQNLTCVLDVSEFPSKAAQMRFLADLAERLFRLHGRKPVPRHLFLEEADDFIPQVVRADQARCTGAWTKLVKQGGSRGLGITLISQRSAVVNKDALTQVETLIALRTTSPQDRKAILGWVDYHAVARELVDSLPGLDDGEAWACSPHWLARHGQPAIQRMRFRQRATYDSGATPVLRKRAPVATLADIDLGVLAERMAAVTRKAQQDDPQALRRRIAELERQAARLAPADAGEVARLKGENADLQRQLAEALNRPPERIEVPVVPPGDVAAFDQAVTAMRETADRIELALRSAPRSAPAAPPPSRPVPVPRAVRVRTPPPPDPGAADVALKPGALRVLEALAARHPIRVTRPQLATLAKMKRTGGAFQAYYSSLRGGGWIAEEDGLISVTPFAFGALGLDAGTGVDDLRETWRGALKPKAWAILERLLEVYPESRTKAELAEAVDMAVSGGGFQGYLTTLSGNGLIEVSSEGLRAADVFFLAEAGSGA